jgi:hypothetical protein
MVTNTIPYRRVLLKHLLPTLEEVGLESRVFGVVGFKHTSEEASNLFRLGREVNGLT